MKLRELIEPKRTTTKISGEFDSRKLANRAQKRDDPPKKSSPKPPETPISPKDVHKKYLSTTSTDSDVGAASYYTPDPRDPHMGILKTIRPTHTTDDHKALLKPNTTPDDIDIQQDISLEEHPKYIWYDQSMEHWQHNPYYPRVYEIDIVADKWGHELPRFRVENLHSYKDYDGQILADLYETLFPLEDVELLDRNNARDCWRYIISKINAMIRGKDVETSDDNLREIVENIKDILHDNSDIFLDFHAGNARIRGTPHGPQIVIIDPIHSVKLN